MRDGDGIFVCMHACERGREKEGEEQRDRDRGRQRVRGRRLRGGAD